MRIINYILTAVSAFLLLIALILLNNSLSGETESTLLTKTQDKIIYLDRDTYCYAEFPNKEGIVCAFINSEISASEGAGIGERQLSIYIPFNDSKENIIKIRSAKLPIRELDNQDIIIMNSSFYSQKKQRSIEYNIVEDENSVYILSDDTLNDSLFNGGAIFEATLTKACFEKEKEFIFNVLEGIEGFSEAKIAQKDKSNVQNLSVILGVSLILILLNTIIMKKAKE